MADETRGPAKHGSAAKPKGRGRGNRPFETLQDKALQVEKKQRRERVAQLVSQGLTLRQIGTELGVDERTVRRDLAEYLAEAGPSKRVEEIREVSDARLERVYERLDVASRVIQQRILAVKKGEAGKPDEYTLDLASQLDGMRVLARTSAVLVSNIESRRRLHGADAPEEKTVRHSGPEGGPIPVASTRVSLAELLALGDENEKAPA